MRSEDVCLLQMLLMLTTIDMFLVYTTFGSKKNLRYIDVTKWQKNVKVSSWPLKKEPVHQCPILEKRLIFVKKTQFCPAK